MNKQSAAKIIEKLAEKYPHADTELKFSGAFELLVAVILSAQCTDKRVNAVTEQLFKDTNTPQAFADMSAEELERRIFSCGFYRNKARSIKAMSERLLTEYNGEVPSDFDSLLKLPGVGRKTANVVYAVGFGGDGLAVDTHVFRVSRRLGLAHADTSDGVERELKALLPQNIWSRAHHYILFHGRYTCKSQRPLCAECVVRKECEWENKI